MRNILTTSDFGLAASDGFEPPQNDPESSCSQGSVQVFLRGGSLPLFGSSRISYKTECAIFHPQSLSVLAA